MAGERKRSGKRLVEEGRVRSSIKLEGKRKGIERHRAKLHTSISCMANIHLARNGKLRMLGLEEGERTGYT